MDAIEAEKTAIEMIMAELALQNGMWGEANERSDIQNGQLFDAGSAKAMKDRRKANADAFHVVPAIYPQDWSGFRSYGTDIPNGVVGVCFMIQEIKRLLMDGVDPTRLARRPDQKYNPETGLPNIAED
ncbi:hypothetical protein [Bradyrhizobium sp. th.b2]|uniref:hypothetical protein n=1 Tax=Bradyrhizobium sp. th-b2 TaxID=172088 RepID=UPI000407DD0D|nr:hypothetical protein [Bradyrhizobium sp. th.b2]